MRLVIALAEAAAANASTTAAASGGGVAGDTCGDAAAAVSSLLSPALCCSAFAVSGDSTPAFRWFVGGDDNDILLGEAGRKAMVDNCHTAACSAAFQPSTLAPRAVVFPCSLRVRAECVGWSVRRR